MIRFSVDASRREDTTVAVAFLDQRTDRWFL